MNYEKMTKAELITKLKSLESGVENSKCIKKEITLQESEEKYRRFIEIANDAIFLVDVETQIILNANKRAEDLLGVPVEEIVGMHRSQIYPQEDIESNEKIFQKNVGMGCVVTSEDIFVLHKDGRKIPVEISVNVFELDDRKVIQEIFRDISYHKHIEQSIKLSEYKYRSLFENMLNGFAYHKIIVNESNKPIDYEFLDVNNSFEILTGLQRDFIIGKKISEVIPDIRNADPDLIKIYGKVALTGVGTNIEVYFEPLKRWFTISVYCPKKEYFVTVFNNITEHKQAEEKINKLNKTLEQRVLERTEELSKANIKIIDSEARFRSILSSLYEAAIIILNRDGRILALWGTPEMDERYGILAAESVGKSIRDFLHQDYMEQMVAHIRNVVDTGDKTIVEHMITVPGGHFWHEISLSPMRNNNGDISAAIGFIRDITERKKSDSERLRLTQILEMTSDFVSTATNDANITYINRSGKKMIGWEDNFKPNSKKIQDAHPEWALNIVKDVGLPSATKDGVWEGETAIIKEDRTEIPVSQVIISHKSPKGDVEFYSTIMRDITERKQAEQALRESSKLNEKIISESPIGLAIYDQTGQCIKANGSIAKMINATQEQVLTQNYNKIESWEKCGLLDMAKECIRLQKNERYEFDVLSSFDKHVFLDCTFVPFMSNQEQHLLLILDDITSRKETSRRLVKKNTYLRLLQVTAVAANEAEDIKDAFLPVLTQICKYTGWEIGHAYAISENNPDLLKPTEVWSLEKVIPFMDFCSITKKTDFTRGVGLPGRVLASCKPHWIEDVTKDSNFLRKQIALDLNIHSGIAFPVMIGHSVVAVLEFFTTQKLKPDYKFMEVMADVGTQLGRIVERKQAGEALMQSERRFRKYFELGLVGMAITSLEKRWVEFNDTLCKMFGYLRKDFSRLTWVELTHPEDLQSDLVQYNRVLAGDIDRYSMEKRFIHRNGSIIYTAISANVLRKADGSVDYFVVLVHDITKRKQMEEALIQSEKMKAMGIMTAGVAHEFNNILAVISSNAQLLEETNRSDKGLSKSLHTICRMADDGAEIVDRMYDFTNVSNDTSHYISVDMNDLIKQVIGFTMPRWKEMAQANGITYQIIRKGVKTLPSVLGSPSELRETILNIINNALDAMPEGGTITVSTRYILSEQSGVESKKEKVSELKSDFIEISFADTGNGMTHEVKKKMFDPFFTTRSPEGTGLGMSISYGIITRHGGEIKVESELGNGSVIYLSLPVTDKSDHKIVTSRKDTKINAESLKILLVDDKEEICESLSKIFKDDGHKVCTSNNGADALRLLKINSYDLLICDLIMPDVNGRDIVNSIKTMKKRPKVGLITGWRYKIEDAEKEGLEVDFIVKKPFNLSRLRRDINDLWV